MVYRSISRDIKEHALVLLHDGWELDDVVEALGVHSRSIERWLDNYEQYGSIIPTRYPQGRPRRLSTLISQELSLLIQESPSLFLDEIVEWLALMHDQPMPLSTLCDNLEDLGLRRKVLRRIALQRDEGLRTAWMDHILRTFTAEQMVFIDESSKDGRTIARCYGRAPSGVTPEEHLDHDHGERYSILLALTLDGYIALRVVPGSVDGDELYDFVLYDLLPRMNAFPAPCSILILDNCNTHKSDALQEAVEANGSILVFLLPYSPDFNPIEESFAAVKAYLRRHWREFENHPFPELALYEACMIAVTLENAPGWFRHSGYI